MNDQLRAASQELMTQRENVRTLVALMSWQPEIRVKGFAEDPTVKLKLPYFIRQLADPHFPEVIELTKARKGDPEYSDKLYEDMSGIDRTYEPGEKRVPYLDWHYSQDDHFSLHPDLSAGFDHVQGFHRAAEDLLDTLTQLNGLSNLKDMSSPEEYNIYHNKMSLPLYKVAQRFDADADDLPRFFGVNYFRQEFDWSGTTAFRRFQKAMNEMHHQKMSLLSMWNGESAMSGTPTLAWIGTNFVIQFFKDRITFLPENPYRHRLTYLGHNIFESQDPPVPSWRDALEEKKFDPVDADRRAELLGLPATKCRWTEFTLAKCPIGEYDDMGGHNIDPLKVGDMVWQTTEGHCFGPDKGDGLYKPFYYNVDVVNADGTGLESRDTDVLRNPANRQRLPQDCFARIRREDDPDFFDAQTRAGRRVRRRLNSSRTTVNVSGNASLHNVLIPCFNNNKCGWKHMPQKGNDDRSAIPKSFEFRSGNTRISLPRAVGPIFYRFSYDSPTYRAQFSLEQFDAVALTLKSIHDSQKSREFDLRLHILGDRVSWSQFQKTDDVSTKSIQLELYYDYDNDDDYDYGPHDMVISVMWSIEDESFIMNVVVRRPWLDKLYYASMYENVNWAETLGITPRESGLAQDIGAVIARNI